MTGTLLLSSFLTLYSIRRFLIEGGAALIKMITTEWNYDYFRNTHLHYPNTANQSDYYGVLGAVNVISKKCGGLEMCCSVLKPLILIGKPHTSFPFTNINLMCDVLQSVVYPFLC